MASSAQSVYSKSTRFPLRTIQTCPGINHPLMRHAARSCRPWLQFAVHRVIRQDHHGIGAAQGGCEIGFEHHAFRSLASQSVVRAYGETALAQDPNDIRRRTLTHIIHIRLICHTQGSDRRVVDIGDYRADEIGNASGLCIVDRPRGPDQTGFIRSCIHDEPRIDRDAVSADARTGSQDVHAWMVVGQGDCFAHVDAQVLRHATELVRERDVDISIGIFHQLDRLGRGGVGQYYFAFDEGRVQVSGSLRGDRIDPAHDPVVGDQFDQDAARQHSLGAVRQREVPSSAQPALLEYGTHHVRGRARRRCRLQYHQIAGFKQWGNGLGCGPHMPQIRSGRAHLRRSFKGCGNRDDVGIRTLRRGLNRQIAGLGSGLEQHVEARLLDVYLSLPERRHQFGVDIDPDHLVALRGKHTGRR